MIHPTSAGARALLPTLSYALAFAIASSLPLLAAGCGGGSGSSESPEGGSGDASTGDERGVMEEDSGSSADSTTGLSDSGSGTADSGKSSMDSGAGGADSSLGGDSGEGADSGSASDSGAISDSGSIADSGAITDSGAVSDSGPGSTDGGDAAAGQVLVTTVGAGVLPIPVTINQGTAIGKTARATPSTLTNVRADPANTETIASSSDPFQRKGNVPDTAAGFCSYDDSDAGDAGPSARTQYTTGTKFEACGADGGPGTDPMVPMAPFYFPLVYNSTVTTTAHGCGAAAPIVGLFDWRPKDIDEAVVAAESDDNGQTWYFMQTVLELNPDYTQPTTGGYGRYSPGEPNGCPPAVTGTNANYVSVNGTTADDGWGHASIIQLPGVGNAATGGQFLYLLDRNTAPNVVDVAPLHVIQLNNATQKFPVANTNNSLPGAYDINSIWSALNNTPEAGTNAVAVQATSGLLNPDGIMAVFPTSPTAAANSPVTVLYVQKILDGDDTGSTALPSSQQCKKAPVSGKTNHDISYVRLATTTDGINFVDHGIVNGLNDVTTVDYNKTRWISPRGTLIDVNGDGSVWGLYFSGGNCLDGDSDAFHFIGYAESTDMQNWTVYNDINNPIASINTITTANQAGGASVTVPANPPVFPTQYWFAERLYAPTAVQIDPTHLSMTFAGYGVQTPNDDLLDYRQIGNVVLTVSKPLPPGVPNNINAH